MRYIICRFLVLVLFSLTVHSVFSQSDKKKKFLKDPYEKAVMDSAEFFFQEKNYSMALVRYQILAKDHPEEAILNFRMGVCELDRQDGIENALKHLQKISISDFEKEHARFYLARAMMLNCKFEEAIPHFEKYIAGKWSSFENRALAETYINNCKYGIELLKNPLAVKIENIGSPINTEYSEYVPLINSEGNMMIFTYRGPKSKGGLQRPLNRNSPPEGEYYEDIFISFKHPETQKWSEPVSISDDINTNANDASVYLRDDGQHFYIFRSVSGDEGSLFLSRLNGTNWEVPEKLYGKINSPWWEGSISVSADGRMAYFSSERPGGFGGKDLYTARLQNDGSWGDIRNMGPVINTALDDDAPFIHPGGEFLLFSSKGHPSMGGYDIFRTDLTSDTSWSKPFNIGYPINTPGDDIYYVISADGMVGYYSSGKAGGFGKQDIYSVTPGLNGKKIKMVRVKGVVTLNDQPVESEIKITFEKSGMVQGLYANNSVSGKYLISLPKEKELVLHFSIAGYESQTRKFSTMEIDSFMESTIDVPFYSPDYLQKLKSSSDSLSRVHANDTSLITNAHSGNSTLTRAEILARWGDVKVEGLIYHVQIGAYNLPENFSYSSVLKYGQVEKQKLSDNITRFTMGKSDNLREARNYCDKIIKAGISDAFVTAEYQGKRYLITELVALNFFMP